MTQCHVSSFKCATAKIVAALAVVLAAGAFFYANQSTVARVGAHDQGSITNPLRVAPAATGLDRTYELLW